ncbi:LLM class flavin-dependent oxidoreductase [Noviherbaspirillum cavernae]|uniref:Luciferase-like monooxygenase n=1 Tax=Noviherbaspirillum cavernae TaxID=2320862 RepID=A0A418X5D1_9BURK|nr:LLM class flavin-dependent oxidoreductase [Noviherbaspirillum cavernae]RJG07655.1 LLM class flavin-dependent oxidoreductase [Noviherbaspirillum cavernae]
MKHLKDIPLSILDLAPIQANGTAADALHRSLDLAQHAERWGFNRFWLAEHHGMPGIASAATAVVIGYVAGGTSRIRVGSGGIMLSNHAPLVIAEQFGTLESLYPGRIDLGLGRAPGSNHATMRALRRRLESDGEEFPQQLAELRAFLQPQSESAAVHAVPGEGLNIPIWLLGSSTFSAQLAGVLGLPFAFAGQFSPAWMQSALELYRMRFQPSDVLDKPYAMVGVNVFAADTEHEAHYLSTSHKQMHVNLVRGVPGRMPPPVASMDGLWLPHEQASVEATLSASIIGSPEIVQEGLKAFVAATQADELIINSMIHDHAARLRSYEIVAHARND